MTKTPTAAAMLGGLGLLPFIALSATSIMAEPEPAGLARHALIAYGATILSFLGGIHWGFALRDGAPASALRLRLTIGVLPQLLGWSALLAPPTAGLWLLAASIAVFVLADRQAVHGKLAPRWFLTLRAPLSASAALCLAASALA